MPGMFLFIALLSAAAGGFMMLRTWRQVSPWLRRLDEAHRCLAGSVREGLVRVEGVAECRETLTSPVHQVPCVGYAVKVEERVRRGRSSHWITRHEDSQILPFEVADSSGRARIEVGSDTSLEFLGEPAVGQDLFRELPPTDARVRSASVETRSRSHPMATTTNSSPP